MIESISKDEKENISSAINAYGMFWSRDLVFWQRKPKLLGQQQLKADIVDMSEQLGIYLLYDRRDIIYVGRSIDRPIGQRLYEHTLDRLRGRWDRFSWFGIYKVSDKGSLIKESNPLDSDTFIKILESILIEALEPPQNRKRGDSTYQEYIQNEDPEITKKKNLAMLNQMQSKFV